MKMFPLAVAPAAFMNSPESFYLHLSGAQHGPYTIPQIDHLLHSGLIGVETLYWREGLDQWQPVTTLIALRKKPRRWVKPVIALAFMILLAVPAHIFGPVLVDGWQEANQHTYGATAAYWRARDVVRNDLTTRRMLVEFENFQAAEVILHEPDQAEVRLRGASIDAHAKATPVVWSVPMRFDPATKEWIGGPPTETTR